MVELHPSNDPYNPDPQSLVNWLETTGTLELGRSLAQVDTEASMKPSALKFVRDPDCSDIPQVIAFYSWRTSYPLFLQIVPNSMSATGTNGLKSSLFTFSPALWPWLSDSTTSPSLPVTGPSSALTVKETPLLIKKAESQFLI